MTQFNTMKSMLAAAFTLGASSLALAQGVPPAPPFQPQAPAQRAQPAAPDPAMQKHMQDMRDARMAMMKAQRAMMLDQRAALLRRALELTPEQQTLFKPVEDAMRALYEVSAPPMQAGMGGPPDLGQRLRARADRMRARADSLTKLADAVGPFRDSLNDQQKSRFDVMSRRAMMMGAMQRHGMMGHGEMEMIDRRGDGGRGWGGGVSGGMSGGMGGMFGMSGMGGMAGHRYQDMVGMFGTSGWPSYNLVPQAMDQRMNRADNGWSAEQGGMFGMSGMGGMGGMGGHRYQDMVGMYGMSGWPSYNRVPQAMDQRMNRADNGWSAEQGGAALQGMRQGSGQMNDDEDADE